MSVPLQQTTFTPVRLVWDVDPVGEEVLVYRRDDTRAILTSKDYLDRDDVLPGFRRLVADLFRDPAGVEPE